MHIYSPQRWAKALDGINGHQVAAGKRLGGLDVQDSKKVVADGSESRRGKKRVEVPKPAPARSQKGKEAKMMFPSSDTSDTSSSDESADFIGAVEEFLRAHQSPHLYPPGPASGEGGSQVGKEAKIWPEEVLWTDSDSAISSGSEHED
ncbi:unnamed protein product [Trifolium pratense]|uniref:Uncharacterized protein n=1 Tax=Trifolium pratense TaxID=57577 RepID=A0ACB0JC70_TRIPR|nr:unnamed protein product [Trifolium pratense]